MSDDYETLVTRITIVPAGEPIYHRRAWSIEIDDDAAGEYVRVRSMDDESKEIRIDPSEWTELREAIESMAARCRADTQTVIQEPIA